MRGMLWGGWPEILLEPPGCSSSVFVSCISLAVYGCGVCVEELHLHCARAAPAFHTKTKRGLGHRIPLFFDVLRVGVHA